MYRVSKELSDAISGDNRRFAVKVTCLGEELPISISKIVYSGGCNGSDTMTIGNTVSAYIEITADSTEILLENKELCLYIGLKLNGKEEYIPIGSFTVKTIENDNGKITLTAYDRMVKLEGLYVTSLENYSISSILGEISNQKGIGIDIPESDIVLDKKPEGYTYREIIGYIASLLGKNALIDRNGRLVFKWYCDMEYTVYSDRIFSIKKCDRPYKIQKAECSSDAETVIRSGDGSNGSRGISFSNPFMTQDILNSIYKVIEGMEFVPLSVSFLGDVTIDAGDVIKVYDKKNLYVVPVMNVEWEYDGGLISRIECVANTDVEEEIDFKGPVNTKIDNIFAELLKVDRFIAKAVTTETLAADVAQIDKLTSNDAVIHNIRATVLTADVINAAVADVGYITADKADLRYANIDLANVEKESVGTLLANIGLITSATITNGHVTGCLDSVEINADSITAGTLIADRLLLKGSKSGLLYQLNNLGELTSTNLNTLDGGILSQRTITADKLVAKSITTNELNVDEIFANSIVSNKLFAQDITATGTITGATIYGSDIIGGYFETDGNYLGIKSSLVLTGGMMMSFIGENDDAGIVASFKTDNFLSTGKSISGITLSCSSGKVAVFGKYNVTTGSSNSMSFTASYIADPNMVLGYGVTNIFSGGIKLIEGALSAPVVYENNVSLSNRYAAINHIHDNYLSLDKGGSVNGGITVSGTIKTSGANRVCGGDKIKMWTDSEGGNIQINSPDTYNGRYYQIDAHNGNLRIYTGNGTSENTASMVLTSEGVLSATGGFKGNLTGNDTSATKAIQDKNGKDITNTYLSLSGGLMQNTISSSKVTTTYLAGNQGQAIINSTAPANSYVMLVKLNSTNGYFTDGVYKDKREFHYTAKSTVDKNTNAVTKSLVLLDESGNSSFPGNLTISGTINNYNIGGSVAQNNNGLITGGNVYNALGNIQIVAIMTTGLLSTGSAVASGTTAVLSTSFEMWEGSTNYIVIPTLFRYCDIESISSSGSKLNITVRNISSASHTLSASFQIIYYKSK